MEQTTLAQQVYDELHERLRAGSLRPGAQLVNRTLAAELGTSTIPVREAIHRLASEGLLELTPGAGAFVRSLDLDELEELYDIREALEGLAAAQAARFAAPHLLAELRALCTTLGRVLETIPHDGQATTAHLHEWLACEEQFHMRVVTASRNRWLIRMVQEVRVISQVFAVQRMSPGLITRVGAERTVREHEAFVEILAARDADRAREWMAAHIRHGRDTVLARLTTEARPR